MHYLNFEKHYLAVDCIIFGFDGTQLNILLVKRNFEPGINEWSLMGGFLTSTESADEAAHRILHALTGLNNIYLEQLYTYSNPLRDKAGRVISIAYFALINMSNYKVPVEKEDRAKWFPIVDYPNTIFDHSSMVEKAMRRLRRKASVQVIGFELLPQKFTIPQLQKLYEAIYNQSFDKRNFRKRVLSIGILEKHDDKDKESSKRGAFYYSLNKSKYDELIENGYHFQI